MDTSNQYIKMCEKAKEIQEHKIEGGDYYYWSVDGNVHISFTETVPGYIVFHPEPWDYLKDRIILWLPRQDQLQEMVEDIEKFDTSIRSITILCNFARFCGIDDEDEEGRSNIHIRKGSMEQLWLAFVMKEKYNKVWDGNQWLEKLS